MGPLAFPPLKHHGVQASTADASAVIVKTLGPEPLGSADRQPGYQGSAQTHPQKTQLLSPCTRLCSHAGRPGAVWPASWSSGCSCAMSEDPRPRLLCLWFLIRLGLGWRRAEVLRLLLHHSAAQQHICSQGVATSPEDCQCQQPWLQPDCRTFNHELRFYQPQKACHPHGIQMQRMPLWSWTAAKAVTIRSMVSSLPMSRRVALFLQTGHKGLCRTDCVIQSLK